MITIAKLSSLAEGTKLRKCARILDGATVSLAQQGPVDIPYLRAVCQIVLGSNDTRVGDRTRAACRSVLLSDGNDRLLWALADASHTLHADLGIEKADWDFRDAHDARLDPSHRTIFPFTVVLDRLRSPFNVGSVFRTGDSFGVRQMVLVQPTASPEHPRAARSARGCTGTIPWEELAEDQVLARFSHTPLFALELGGTDIASFEFPTTGAVVLGSEELGVSPSLLALADASLGRVSIPLSGSKGSLNVSVAFGILMHAWYNAIRDR